MDDDDDADCSPIQGLIEILRLFWGPLFWPMLALNAGGGAWCLMQMF